MFPNLLFLTAGGKHPEYNFGHLSRCVMSADRIKRGSPKAACHFLIPKDSAGIDFLVHSGHKPRVLKGKSFSFHETKKAVESVKADILILDRLDWPAPFIRKLKTLDKVLVLLDDGGASAALADVSLNPLIENRRSDFKGYRYLLLSESHKKAKCPPTAKRIVLSFGGNEPKGLTLQCLEQLRKMPEAHRLDLQIFRPGAGEKGLLSREHLRGFAKSSRIHDFGRDFFKILDSADTLLTGGGLTLFEGVKRGLVSGIVELRAHQKGNIRKLSQAGAVERLGDFTQVETPGFSARLKALLLQKKKRSTLHKKSIQYWDSLEFSAPVEKILQVITRDPKGPHASLWAKRLTPAVQRFTKNFCTRNKIQTIHYRLPHKRVHV